MPNKNYIKGRAKEYKLKAELEKQGYTVLRTAGSHGFADLIAINYELDKISFIQVKPDKYSDGAIAKLMKKYAEYNNIWTRWKVNFEVL